LVSFAGRLVAGWAEKERSGLSIRISLSLAKAFGGTAKLWFRLQLAYGP
jgi:plasmid maintenance system antidote protein VapI